MSGCGCGQPVILTNPAPPARVDVETVLLCDVLTDGTTAATVLIEPVYDTNTGERIGTRTVNPTTGTDYTVQGQLRSCSPESTAGCDQPTTPTATVGLCLADGTPIAVTVIRDCTGTITSEGWINLATGAWSAGAPPAGTVACGGSRSIQVSGTFCDLDPDNGDVLGLVLIEYSYAADGTIADVRLVDAITGATYTPQGTITVCPAGVAQPEQDLIQLCDTLPDGTNVPFIRDYRRDENGTIVGHTDYTLDGSDYVGQGTVALCPAGTCHNSTTVLLCDTGADDTTPFLRHYVLDTASGTAAHNDTTLDGESYAPTGDVGVCPAPECVAGVQTLRLCDMNPDAEPDEEGRRCATPFLRAIAYDCTGQVTGVTDTTMDGVTPYTPVSVTDCECSSGGGGAAAFEEVPWAIVGVVEDPNGTPQQDFIYTVAPENDPTRIGTIHVHVSRPAGGACGPYDINSLIFSNSATYTLTLDAIAQQMSYLRVDLIDFDTFEPVGINAPTPRPSRLGGTAEWNAANTRIVPTESNGTGYLFWDTPPPTISYTIFNTGGGTSCSLLSFQGMTLEPGGCCCPTCNTGGTPDDLCAKQVIERCGCDDTNGDGIGDVTYTELWAVDPCGGEAPELLGTYLDGDLTQPYTPLSPVDCTGAETLPGPLSTGVRAVTGPAAQDVAASFPGLQSVSLTVLAGTVNVTMSDGTNVPIPAGVTMTWSVAQDPDVALAAAGFAGATAEASYLLNWTYR